MISEFPLFVFTLLAGLSAGACVAGVAIKPSEDAKRPWLFPLVCLILLGVGLFGVLFHLGRPAMFINGLTNPHAGIAQEAYWSIAFGALLLAVLVLSWKKGSAPFVLRFVCAIAAFGLLVTMGVTYYGYESVSAWHVPTTILLFVVSGLAGGAVLAWAMNGGCEQKSRAAVCLLAAFAALVFAIECVALRGAGAADILLAISAVVCTVTAVLAVVRSSNSQQYKWAVFAVAFVAVICARYGFYCAM